MPKWDYRIHTYQFSLQSDGPVDPVLMDQIYPTSLQELGLPVQDQLAPATVHRFGVQRTANEFVLSFDDQSVFRSSSMEQMYSELEWTITNAALDALGQYLQLHAGGIAVNDDALLIVAGHGMGKTSLVTAMMLEGGRPLSDDIILIDPVSQELRSFPRAFKMSAFHAQALPELSRHLELVDFSTVDHIRVNPESISGSSFAREASCKLIVFLEDERRDAPLLLPIGQANAFTRLLQASLNFKRHGQAGVEALSRMVESASCFVLHVGPLRETSRLLCDLLHKPPRGQVQ
jgi:hypothetical protein